MLQPGLSQSLALFGNQPERPGCVRYIRYISCFLTDRDGLIDINGEEELGCSRWSFTRICNVLLTDYGPGARASERSLGRAQNDKFFTYVGCSL